MFGHISRNRRFFLLPGSAEAKAKVATESQVPCSEKILGEKNTKRTPQIQLSNGFKGYNKPLLGYIRDEALPIYIYIYKDSNQPLLAGWQIH